MPTPQITSNQDKWLEGELLDLTSLPESQQKLAANYRTPSTDAERWADVFGGIDDPLKGKRQADIELDPEIYEELARRDPAFKRQLDDQKIEAITLEFTESNPDYLSTEANYDKVVRYIRKHQLKDPGVPLDDIVSVAYANNLWTVRNLTVVFKTLVREGVMEMPKGKTKPLSKDEGLDVLAMVRQGDVEGAILQFITYAFGGSLPRKYRDPREFLRDNAALASEAAEWVFFQSNAHTIDANEWKQFRKARLAGRQMLTYKVIEDAWNEWQFSGKRDAVSETVGTAPAAAPRDPNTLSAAELDEAILEARRNYRNQ